MEGRLDGGPSTGSSPTAAAADPGRAVRVAAVMVALSVVAAIAGSPVGVAVVAYASSFAMESSDHAVPSSKAPVSARMLTTRAVKLLYFLFAVSMASCFVGSSEFDACVDWGGEWMENQVARSITFAYTLCAALGESCFVQFVQSPSPSVGGEPEVDCFAVSLFVIGAMRVLLRVYINFIRCPHRILPNLPRFPQKAGNKSTRHRSCTTRKGRRRRECLVHNSRKSACSSWRVQLRCRGDLVYMAICGLIAISFASQMHVLRMSCGYVLAAIAMSICGAPASIARAVGVGSMIIAWVTWAGGFASGFAVRVACRVAGAMVRTTMFWTVVETFFLTNVAGFLLRLLLVWRRIYNRAQETKPHDCQIQSIRIKTITGSWTACLDIAASRSVLDLKSLISAEYDAPPSCQRLNFAGKQLDHDQSSLADCGVSNGSTIYVSLPLCGSGNDAWQQQQRTTQVTNASAQRSSILSR